MKLLTVTLALAGIITANPAPIYTHEVVIDGNVYEYTSTADGEEMYTAEDFIVTTNGEVVYIADLEAQS